MSTNKEIPFLKKIDGLGRPFDLTFGEEIKFKTELGGVLTIICLCVIIMVFFLLAYDMIQKTNPSSLGTVTPTPDRLNLSYNINIAYVVQDQFGNTAANYSKYFSILGFYKNWSNFDGLNTVLSSNLTGKPCNIKDFASENSNYYLRNNLDSAICFNNKNLTVGGYLDSFSATFLAIELVYCQNSTQNNNSCKSIEEINEWLVAKGPLEFYMYYEDVNYNAMNYTYPRSYGMKVLSYMIDMNFCKVENNFFHEVLISTDDGIMTQSLHNKTYQKIKDTDNRFYSRNSSDPCIIKLRFFTSDEQHTYLRSYMKIQSLLGQLGVVFNAIFSAFGVLTSGIYSSIMKEIVLTKVFHVSPDDLIDEDSNKNQVIELKLNKKDNILNSLYTPRKEILDIELKNHQNEKSEIELKDQSSCILEKSLNVNLSLEKKIEMSRNNCEKNFSISLQEHVISKFFSCFKGENLKNKEKIFQSLENKLINYTDILEIVHTKTELEKLKNILFSKEQLALFNMISSPEIPNKTNFKKKISHLHKFSEDKKEQEEEISKLNEKIKSKNHILSPLDKTLIELID